MFDINEYAEAMNRIRTNVGVFTNNFLPISKIEKISLQKDSKMYFYQGALAFCYDDNLVTRACFTISTLSNVGKLEQFFDKGCKHPLVVECVGREEDIIPLYEPLEKIGFHVYTRMSRWGSNYIKHFSELEELMTSFAIAGEEHAKSILGFLNSNFDPLISHLPDTPKLKALIADGMVFCQIVKEQVSAVACLERNGKNGVYLYQYAVSQSLRKERIGSAIFQFAFEQFPDCRRFTSWTTDDNDATNRIHEKFGLKRDGLKNTIMIYQ